jgi:hypothetical protein
MHSLVYHPRKMTEDLKNFEAVFVLTRKFAAEDEGDAVAVAEDIALLEGTELIYLVCFPSASRLNRPFNVMNSTHCESYPSVWPE